MSTITLQQYLDSTVRRMMVGRPEAVGSPECRMNWALGLCSEAGEIADVVKKAQDNQQPIDLVKLKNETGDASWYLFALAVDFWGVEGALAIWDAPRPVLEDGRRSLSDACLEVGFQASFLASMVTHTKLDDDTEFERDNFVDVLEGLRLVAERAPEPFELEEAWALNAAKLQRRFPNGFDAAASRNRSAAGQ